jgi:alkanesulfonate monooxygenase SsuD/methylene tetrahydromethanopterin reductase-like flavin-dependent oxidoreductase (luciferase family)
MKKFRFGASPGFAETATQWRELAKQVEAWGYSTLLLPDHFVNPFSPVPALAMAAEATTTLRVGTMVFDNDFRHPALLAKDAATIDFLSDGRFELGIGAGWGGVAPARVPSHRHPLRRSRCSRCPHERSRRGAQRLVARGAVQLHR